jgi:uncharacterized protein Yka (UPF0111/DUF47 family)
VDSQSAHEDQMKNKKILNVLNEEFFKFVRESEINGVIEKHCKDWQPKMIIAATNSIAEKLVQELKVLFARYLQSGVFKSPRESLTAAKSMKQVLNVLQDDLEKDRFSLRDSGRC